MRKQRNALLGALVWWFAGRWVRKKANSAASALPGVRGSGEGRGKLGVVLGGLAVVGALVGGLVAWRKLSGPAEPNYPSAARAQQAPAPTTGGDSGGS